jgi:hypothetical protein
MPCGRAMALAQRTPWSHRGILDTQAWASRLDMHHGMWPRQRPLAIARGTRIDSPMDLPGLQGLSHHGQQMPLPLLAQHAIRHVVQGDPLPRLLIPSATRAPTAASTVESTAQVRVKADVPTDAPSSHFIALCRAPLATAVSPSQSLASPGYPGGTHRWENFGRSPCQPP